MLGDMNVTPPGWYPDPARRFEHRYWDGYQWTEHVGTQGRQWVDPLPPAPPVQVVAQPCPPTPQNQPEPPRQRQTRDVRKAGVTAAFQGGGTLFTEPILVFKQAVKGRKQNVEYSIFDQHGRQLGSVQEVKRGMFRRSRDRRRGLSERNRRYLLQVTDLAGAVWLQLKRPENLFAVKSTMHVLGGDGTSLGTVSQESLGVAGAFATYVHDTIGLFTSNGPEGLDKVGHVRFGLTAGKQRLGAVVSESTEEAEFRIEDSRGVEVARLTKNWGGFLKEQFTSADSYVVQFHAPIGGALGAMIISSTVAIDIAIKEGSSLRGDSYYRRYK